MNIDELSMRTSAVEERFKQLRKDIDAYHASRAITTRPVPRTPRLRLVQPQHALAAGKAFNLRNEGS